MDTKKVTTCTDCNRTIPYKNKKPKHCQVCRAKHKKPYRKRTRKQSTSNVPHRSKKEATVQRVLNDLLPIAGCIDNGYYSWLLSPCKFPIQLDRYYPELGFAIEVQGQQHYKYSTYFHATEEAFKYLQECDKLKVKLCQQRSIKLIHIRYDRTITKEYLIRRLTDEGIMDNIRAMTEVNE